VGFAAHLVSEVMSQMLVAAALAVAGGIATHLGDGGQRSRQERFGGPHPLETAIEHATDIAGMTTDVHGNLRSVLIST